MLCEKVSEQNQGKCLTTKPNFIILPVEGYAFFFCTQFSYVKPYLSEVNSSHFMRLESYYMISPSIKKGDSDTHTHKVSYN